MCCNFVQLVIAFKAADQISYRLFIHAYDLFWCAWEWSAKTSSSIGGSISARTSLLPHSLVEALHYPFFLALTWDWGNVKFCQLIEYSKQSLFQYLVQEDLVFLSCPLIPPTMLQAYAKKHSRSPLSFSHLSRRLFIPTGPKKSMNLSSIQATRGSRATAISKSSSITAVLSAKGVFQQNQRWIRNDTFSPFFCSFQSWFFQMRLPDSLGIQ